MSNTLEADWCVAALQKSLQQWGKPTIFNTDQGSQFTSDDFVGVLQNHQIAISWDGKGRALDNIYRGRPCGRTLLADVKPGGRSHTRMYTYETTKLVASYE